MIHLPHLETDITQACQLSCVACNHSVPLWRARKGGPWSANPLQVEKDLTTLAKFVHTDRWGALGGEPTLHRDLISILHIAKQSGIADKTEVWTNGLTAKKQSAEFWRSFDVLVLSIYPGKLDDDHILWIVNKCRDEGVELITKDERYHPNFKTMLEPRPDMSAARTQAKFDGCFFRWFSRVANFGYFFTCCCGPHIPFLIQEQPFGTDGIAIEGLTEQALHAYLHRRQPLGACRQCAGRDTAVDIKWQERRDPAEWLLASAGEGVKR